MHQTITARAAAAWHHLRQVHHGATAVSVIPSHVKIYEMSPRDGLQSQPGALIPTHTKKQLIEDLSSTGLRFIESTSFVNKKLVPQLADAEELCNPVNGFRRKDGVVYSALTPNKTAIQAAIAAQLPEVAVFAAATDSFSKRNINCNVMDSLERFKPVMEEARAHGIKVRGYVSCVLGCPYEGPVAPDAVGFVAQSLLEMGCYEISLGDTIGVGTPAGVKRMLAAVKAHVPVHALALHAHDTYGMAIANVLAALEEGVATVDSSVAGLGGCPYAKGASGNVATEDVVYLLHGLGVSTGVDLDALVDAGDALCKATGIPNKSKVAVARLAQRASLAAAQEAERKLAGQEGPDAAAALAKARANASDGKIGLRWPEPPPAAFPGGLAGPVPLPSDRDVAGQAEGPGQAATATVAWG